jgi:hypothetical protein
VMESRFVGALFVAPDAAAGHRQRAAG